MKATSLSIFRQQLGEKREVSTWVSAGKPSMAGGLEKGVREKQREQREDRNGLGRKPWDKQHHEEEHLLIRRVQAGDEKAFEVLFRRYCCRVYRQAVALVNNEAEAEEVVQEVFLTLYKKAKTFRGDSVFSTWLYRISINAALTKLRRRRRSREVAIDYMPKHQEEGHHVRPVVDWSRDLEQHVISAELQRVLQHVLDQLQPKDKAVVVLSDLEGISNQEIAKALSLSVPAVKSRLHRARVFLRAKLVVSLAYVPKSPSSRPTSNAMRDFLALLNVQQYSIRYRALSRSTSPV